MHAFIYFLLICRTTLSSWPGLAAIFQVTSVLPFFFIAKNATVTAYLLESSLAQFKKSRPLFYNDKVDKVFARIQIKNENIQLLLIGSLFVSSSMKERESSYSAETFLFPRALVACKTSKFVTKEISLLLLPQTP